MITTRRRYFYINNSLLLLTLYNNSKKLSNIIKLELTNNTKIQNYILSYFLLKALSSNFKSPKVHYKKFLNKLGNTISTNCILRLRTNSRLQNQILHYISEILIYRAYAFKEAVLMRTNSTLSIFFIKLPNNFRTFLLEEISSGEAINFKLDILGSWSNIEYIYLLNIFGFIGHIDSLDECGFEMDAVIDTSKSLINIDIDDLLFTDFDIK